MMLYTWNLHNKISLKKKEESTQSYFPHILPSATTSNDQNF